MQIIQYLVTYQKTEIRIGNIGDIKKEIEDSGMMVTSIQTITI